MHIGRVIKDGADAVLHAATHSKRIRGVADNLHVQFGTHKSRVTGLDESNLISDISPTSGRNHSNSAPTPERFPSTPDPQVQDPDLVDWDVVNAIDTRTGPNDATFWSGRVLDADGNTIPDATQLGAQDLTNGTHGETLEQLLERQGMTDRMPSDWNDPSTDATWREVSTRLAQNASGDVRAFVGDVRAQSVWNECELPTLVRNDGIKSITLIDAATGGITNVFIP